MTRDSKPMGYLKLRVCDGDKLPHIKMTIAITHVPMQTKQCLERKGLL